MDGRENLWDLGHGLGGGRSIKWLNPQIGER